jgi:Glycosyl transferase family 2
VAARPASTICIASINTAWATELCLRSLEVRDAGRPYRVIIGDSGSTDGTLPMLVRMLQRGVVDDIELAAGGRRHAAWIDHWVATCPTEYLVLLDSDVEIRQDGWLADMHRERAEHEAVLVTAELEPPRPEWTKPGVQMEARPAAYCMLLDVAKVRALGRSFEEWYDGSVGYDVGAWVFAGIVDAGMSYAVMPQSWLPAVRHWGAMSYARNVRQLRAQHRATTATVGARLLAYRVAGRAGAEMLTNLRDVRAAVRRSAHRQGQRGAAQDAAPAPEGPVAVMSKQNGTV